MGSVSPVEDDLADILEEYAHCGWHTHEQKIVIPQPQQGRREPSELIFSANVWLFDHETGYNSCMTHYLRNLVLIIALIMFSGGVMKAHSAGNEQPESLTAQEEEYTLDPVLSGGENAPYRPAKSQVIAVDKRKDQTRIQLESEGQVAPYVGAGGAPPPAEDVVPLLSKEEQARHENIHLETGIGVNVNENANVNLGYRIKKNPSLLEEPDKDNGQVRFGIDFQLPTK